MKLITKEIERRLEKHPFGSQDGEGKGAQVLVKFFGGSARNWQTCLDAGCVIKIYNVPAAKAQEAVENPPYKGMVCAIEQPETIDRAALIAEREKLIARIAEIDAQLAES